MEEKFIRRAQQSGNHPAACTCARCVANRLVTALEEPDSDSVGWSSNEPQYRPSDESNKGGGAGFLVAAFVLLLVGGLLVVFIVGDFDRPEVPSPELLAQRF